MKNNENIGLVKVKKYSNDEIQRTLSDFEFDMLNEEKTRKKLTKLFNKEPSSRQGVFYFLENKLQTLKNIVREYSDNPNVDLDAINKSIIKNNKLIDMVRVQKIILNGFDDNGDKKSRCNAISAHNEPNKVGSVDWLKQKLISSTGTPALRILKPNGNNVTVFNNGDAFLLDYDNGMVSEVLYEHGKIDGIDIKKTQEVLGLRPSNKHKLKNLTP